MAELVLYTAAEVADVLRLNHQVVQRKLQAGEIPGYRIGREWRVEQRQLMEWLERHSNRRSTSPDARTLATYVADDGSLRSIPAQRSKRTAVLRYMADSLEPDRTYTERELNAALRRFHDDVATIRREMVAIKLLVRTPDGVYKRTAPRQPALRRS